MCRCENSCLKFIIIQGHRQHAGPGGGGGAARLVCSHNNYTVNCMDFFQDDLARGTTVKMLMSSEGHDVGEGLTF